MSVHVLLILFNEFGKRDNYDAEHFILFSQRFN